MKVYTNIFISILIISTIFLIYRRFGLYEGFFDSGGNISGCTTDFPKSIFQTWKSRTEFPENFDYWRKTWIKYNPSYKYIVFDDNDNRKFIETNFPWFLARFDVYNKPIKKADAIRYFYLYLNGGIYADLDFECLKSFDSLFMENSGVGVLLGCMQDADDIATTSANNVPNAIMVSKPREEFWLCMFHILLQRGVEDGNTENETGPIALKDAYLLYKNGNYKNAEWYKDIVAKLTAAGIGPCGNNGVTILPSTVLYPISWERPDMKVINDEMLHAKDRAAASKKVVTLFPDSYAATYWTHSWGNQ
jgi:hypothetical protein